MMLLHRSKVYRRYKVWSLLDIHKARNDMQNERLIRFTPHKALLALVPHGCKETPSFCWICRKIVWNDEHYERTHIKYTANEIRSLKMIGRGIMNRFGAPGPQQFYKKSKNRRDALLKHIQAEYGVKTFQKTGLKNNKPPKERTMLKNRSLTEANKMIKRLLETHPISRTLRVRLDSLVLCRWDLTRYQRLFCISCHCWVQNGWQYHNNAEHDHLSDLQQKALLLYSTRLKAAVFTKILLTRNSVVTDSWDTFAQFMMRANYTFSSMVIDIKKSDGLLKRTNTYKNAKWYSTVQVNSLASPSKVIRFAGVRCELGGMLDRSILVKAYNLYNSLYNKDSRYKGFTNAMVYKDILHAKDFNGPVIKNLQLCTPPGSTALNFLGLKQVVPARMVNNKFVKQHVNGHMIFSHFDDNFITIYEGMGFVRKRPVGKYLKGLLRAHYGHCGELKFGFSQRYSLQDDQHTCSYRAVFCCLAFLANEHPENFEPQFKQLFTLVKLAVDQKGRRLRKWSIEKVWNFVAKPKEGRKTKEVIKFIPL